MQNDSVLIKQDGHVLQLTINRPEARNAVNMDVAVALGDALERADGDREIHVVVITGAGDQAFCAGADLKALSRGEKIVPEDAKRAAWGFAGVVKHPIAKPVIAAVNGAALGGGTELTLAADLAIAAETATFGLPEVKRGLIAGAGGAFRLAGQLPHKIAMELLLTGDAIDAARALSLGLVNAVLPPADVLEHAMALGHRIAANAPLSVQASKRVARGTGGDASHPLESFGWGRTTEEMSVIRTSEDAREGARAFAEKRAPVWTAR